MQAAAPEARAPPAAARSELHMIDCTHAALAPPRLPPLGRPRPAPQCLTSSRRLGPPWQASSRGGGSVQGGCSGAGGLQRSRALAAEQGVCGGTGALLGRQQVQGACRRAGELPGELPAAAGGWKQHRRIAAARVAAANRREAPAPRCGPITPWHPAERSCASSWRISNGLAKHAAARAAGAAGVGPLSHPRWLQQ